MWVWRLEPGDGGGLTVRILLSALNQAGEEVRDVTAKLATRDPADRHRLLPFEWEKGAFKATDDVLRHDLPVFEGGPVVDPRFEVERPGEPILRDVR